MLEHLVPAPDGAPFPAAGACMGVAAADGLRLRCALWRSTEPGAGQIPGTVFILQGRTEFIEKYAEVIGELLGRGFAVVAFDWRGQGGSERQLANPRKGHVEDFDDYLIDLDAVIAEAIKQGMPRPFHILAHSMGGAIALLALARGDAPFERAMLSAPLAGIASMPGGVLVRPLMQVLSGIGFSGFRLPFMGSKSLFEKPFEGNPLTADAARFEHIARWISAEPFMALGDPTIGWIDAMFHAFDRFAEDGFGRDSRTPILMMVAGRDEVVDSYAAEALAARLRGASAIRIPGARHEILIEGDAIRAQFWAAFDAFIPHPEGFQSNETEARSNQSED